MGTIDKNNMIINDIEIENITNATETGVFDKLMEAVNNNINKQYQNNRINHNDYANVYLGSIQAVLSQSIQFALQEQLTEAQVASVVADNELKAKQLEIAEIERQSKQYEFDNLLPEQLSTLYADRVLKDKQAAKLGLDNVMKNSEASKDSDSAFVYAPKYQK